MLSTEKDMYPDVIRWLQKFLIDHFSKSDVYCFDTSRVYLNDFLSRKGFSEFRDSATYEIKVDITGIIRQDKKSNLIFIECKLSYINLKDISQLLGYSKVAQPLYSLIISPKNVSDPVNTLFRTYKRYDVLKYTDKQEICIAKWNVEQKDIDYNSIIPPGYFAKLHHSY